MYQPSGPFPGLGKGMKQQYTAGLRQRLDDQHAGHDLVVGKMAQEKRLVVGDIFQGQDGFLGLDLLHPVNQQKGIPMGKDPQDFFYIKDGRAIFLWGLLRHRIFG